LMGMKIWCIRGRSPRVNGTEKVFFHVFFGLIFV
jgi:hypothetical protein